MADIALTTAGRVEVIYSQNQKTHPAGATMTAGAAVIQGTATTGAWILADGVTNKGGIHITTRAAQLGEPVTAIRKGLMDGFNVAGMALNDPVYASNTPGNIATGTGTGNLQIGRIVAAHGTPLGTAADKILEVDAPL